MTRAPHCTLLGARSSESRVRRAKSKTDSIFPRNASQALADEAGQIRWWWLGPLDPETRYSLESPGKSLSPSDRSISEAQ